MSKKVTIKSMVNKVVVINAPEYQLRREWPQKGAVQTIDLEVLKEAIFKPGIENLFKLGVLYIDSMEDKIALGLEPDTAEKPKNIIVLDDKEVQALFEMSNLNAFKYRFKQLPPAQRKEVASYAIRNELMIDFSKNEFILKSAGIDIMNAIRLKRADKEE